MTNRAREPDPGGTPTRMSGPMAGEELTKGREQEQEPRQEQRRTGAAVGSPVGRPSTGGSKRYADTTETDTTGTGATGAGQPHSSEGGTTSGMADGTTGGIPRP